jgi:hypothetical protein
MKTNVSDNINKWNLALESRVGFYYYLLFILFYFLFFSIFLFLEKSSSSSNGKDPQQLFSH